MVGTKADLTEESTLDVRQVHSLLYYTLFSLYLCSSQFYIFITLKSHYCMLLLSTSQLYPLNNITVYVYYVTYLASNLLNLFYWYEFQTAVEAMNKYIEVETCVEVRDTALLC